MRIVIDMQGAQTESRFRGIGRYSLSLALAIARNCDEHEVILALNGLFSATIEPIRAAFEGLLPQQNIRIWYALGPTRECDSANAARRNVAEMIREASIMALQPDVVLVTSLFEGLGDDAVTSVGRFDTATPTAVVLYDLIPLISPDIHYQTNSVHIGYYGRKIESIRHGTALLAISESARNEALIGLKVNQDQITNISSGCDPRFHKVDTTESERKALFNKFSITRPFLMYSGGADERKNLPRLVEAFAKLPIELRERHQLVMVGKMPETSVAELRGIANQAGLTDAELAFTGYVSDLELMQLYGLCRLFVFPSLHEGFGLPPLEAMACGAPVIASNATSLPEVIGRNDAMFDPLSVEVIANKIAQVLSDDPFREELVRYGTERAKKFSWDYSAKLAIAALERIADRSCVINAHDETRMVATGIFRAKRDLILVSKLDHMGDLVLAIPAIMKLRARYPNARIDALVGSWNVSAAEKLGVFEKIHVLDFFAKESSVAAVEKEERILSLVNTMPEYDLAIDFRRQADTRFILLKFAARQYVGYSTGNDCVDALLNVCVPTMPDKPFVMTALNATPISMQMLRIVDALPAEINDYVRLPELIFSCVPHAGEVAIFPNAGNDVKEWGRENFRELVDLLLANSDVSSVIIYTTNAEESGPYTSIDNPKFGIRQGLCYEDLLASLSKQSVCVANNSFGAHIASYLGLRVLGVYAGHETVAEWGPVFGDAFAIYSPVECSPCHIAHREDCLNAFRCIKDITPELVFSAVQRLLSTRLDFQEQRTIEDVRYALTVAVAREAVVFSNDDRFQLASCIARSIQIPRKPQIFVDISMLVWMDAKTGIQRVTRSILKYLLEQTALEYEVVPVYATMNESGYRCARQFTSRFLGDGSVSEAEDELIDYQARDVFLGLDLQPQVVPAQRKFLETMREHGVRIFFVVYDLLCLQMPARFEIGADVAFQRWLGVVAEGDGALCISRATASELSDWLAKHSAVRARTFNIEWFHIGADIASSCPTRGIPTGANVVFQQMIKRTSFLMVGTLEPRKGHAFVLEAFDLLWKAERDVNLVIVGKQGWNVEEFCNSVRGHPEFNRRLFWLEAISDEYLEEIYARSDCLIAASEGEGFGLPLIEAARHKLPIIARDLSVFREVAERHAFYFKGFLPSDLVLAIDEWLVLYAQEAHPSSADMSYLTWDASAEQMMLKLKKMLSLNFE